MKLLWWILVGLTGTTTANETFKFDFSPPKFPLPPEPRIIKGEEATKEDFPPIVSLSYYHQPEPELELTGNNTTIATTTVKSVTSRPSSKDLRPFCGGTIIHRQWVLTAAHCLEDLNETVFSPLRIRVGYTNLANGKPKEPGEADFEVEKFIKHPKHNNSDLEYDLGLVKVKGEFESGRVAKVNTKVYDMEGLSATALGWGSTSPFSTEPVRILMKITQKICEKDWAEILEYKQMLDDPNHFICLGLKTGEGICGADFGGPLILVEDKILIGVSSWSLECGEAGFFMPVAPHVDWIQKHIGHKFVAGGAVLGSSCVWVTVSFLVLCNVQNCFF